MWASSRARWAVALGALVLVVAGTGAAAVSRSSEKAAGGGAIKACAAKNGVISLKKGPCPKGSKFLKWTKKGKRGKKGPTGPPGLVSVTVRTEITAVPPGDIVAQKVFCRDDEYAVGGAGYWGQPPSSTMVVLDTAPLNAEGNLARDGIAPRGWVAEFSNGAGGIRDGRTYVQCVRDASGTLPPITGSTRSLGRVGAR